MAGRTLEMLPHADAVPRLLKAIEAASGTDLLTAQRRLWHALGKRPSDTLRRQWTRWEDGTVLPRSMRLSPLVKACQELGWVVEPKELGAGDPGIAALLAMLQPKAEELPAGVKEERRGVARTEPPDSMALAGWLLALAQADGAAQSNDAGLGLVFTNLGSQVRNRSDLTGVKATFLKVAKDLRAAADTLDAQSKK